MLTSLTSAARATHWDTSKRRDEGFRVLRKTACHRSRMNLEMAEALLDSILTKKEEPAGDGI